MNQAANKVEISVSDLLRQMLECVNDAPSPAKVAGMSGNSQEVVLTVNLDGARYVLMRSYQPERKSGFQLSPREMEIVRLVSRGFPNKTVASILDISPWTVATHLRRIFAKLEVNSRAEMVAKILNEGRRLQDT